MKSRLKQVAAAVKLSAQFTSSAWRSNKTSGELTAGLSAESLNRPQILLSIEDEDKNSFVGVNESSVVVDETCNSSWSEVTAKLRAERINRPQIILSNEDEDEDSFVRMDESSMTVDESNNSSWSEVTAKLRAERNNRPQIILSNEDEDENSLVGIDESSMVVGDTFNYSWSEEIAKLRAERTNRPQIIFSDEEEDEDSFVSTNESSMAVDETHISSSVSEKYSKFKRPSSLRWTMENANSVILIGSICNFVRFKYTDSGRPLVWTSIEMRDEKFKTSGRVGVYFLDELADIVKQHLKIYDYVHISGELAKWQRKIWVMAKDLKFVQHPISANTGHVSQLKKRTFAKI